MPTKAINCTTFVELLQWRADRQPDQLAYAYSVDEKSEELKFSYGELDLQARAIAGKLQGFCQPGDRALLLYPPGLDYIAAFFGCLYAGIIAIPAYPPRLNKFDIRLQAILADAEPQVILTTAAFAPTIESWRAATSMLRDVRTLVTDTDAAANIVNWQSPKLIGNTLALLQYTSGSTASPKGVMLTHGNLLYNSALIRQCFHHTTKSIGVSWLPPYHDMGLIGSVLQPLYAGFPVTLMSPLEFLQRPYRWLQLISKVEATTSGGPNFAYELCIKKTTPEQRATLDLSTWTKAFSGAEAIRADTLERFAAAFEPAGFRQSSFYPCYGLAEATLIVSGYPNGGRYTVCHVQAESLARNQIVEVSSETHGSSTLVGCGHTLGRQTIVVVDPGSLSECSAGQIGEIWVSGPSIAKGYWNRSQETTESFLAYLAESGEGPFLRTGDLGFLRRGELFIAGRRKDLIIIRGRNYYPQDIEVVAERCHEALQPEGAAAFSIEVGGEERLVIVCELTRTHRDASVAEVAATIRQAIFELYELNVYAVVLLTPGSLPKTSSGKVQRYVCKEGFLNGTLRELGRSIQATMNSSDGEVRPTDDQLTRNSLWSTEELDRHRILENHLQVAISEVLNIPPHEVNRAQSLSAFGLDSLMAVELKHAIETSLGIALPLPILLGGASIHQLAIELHNRLVESPVNTAPSIPSLRKESGEHPLSYGQRAIWLLHQLAPESTVYNIARAVRITGDLDIQVFQYACQLLIDRHSSLRTTFSIRGGEPFQQIHDSVEVSFKQEDASAWSESVLQRRLNQEAQRPFDLEKGSLLRINLFRCSAHEYILLFTIHHIVADLWSLMLLIRDLDELYTAEKLGVSTIPELPHTEYPDYVRWQSELLASAEGDRLWEYWHRQLANVPGRLDLPTDRSRPPVQTHRGESHSFTFDQALSQGLRALARDHQATLYMVLLAGFQLLLSRYTGEKDVIVGSPMAGRTYAGTANLVGYFVNPAALRADLSERLTFAAFLQQVRQTVLNALEHQDYPFPLLVQRLQPERDISSSPLFQVMFLLQRGFLSRNVDLSLLALGEPGAQFDLGQLSCESVALRRETTQFDLTLAMADVEGSVIGVLQYNADLFDDATIIRMGEHLQTLLTCAVTHPDSSLADLELLTEGEYQQLITEWNSNQVHTPPYACAHHWFEKVVEDAPDSTALTFGNRHLTYKELNHRANQVAAYLQELGVGPDVPVGICMRRSPELVVGILGVLKAGGAYVPIDPTYPEERLAYMLKDAQISVLLTDEHLPMWYVDQGTRLIRLDSDWSAFSQMNETNPASQVTGANLAYVAYTSGSAGLPKGVAVEHKSLVNYLGWALNTLLTSPIQHIPFSSSPTFDAILKQLFGPLLRGSDVWILPETITMDPSALLKELCTRTNVGFNCVPSAWKLVLEEIKTGRYETLKESLRGLLVSGEPFTEELLDQSLAALPNLQVWNLYGPTETTANASASRLAAGDRITIGRPIANTQIYLLDNHIRPVPVGVIGQLYIGGEGLARCYFNQPELTAEKFIPNPYSDTPGARLYKTGDRARFLPNGNIELLGRVDRQIKIRGYRIELAEIEDVLNQYPGLSRNAVISVEDRMGDKHLVAYVVLEEDLKRTISPVLELRSFLQSRLPSQMIPSHVVMLDKLPMTPSGKVNYQALSSLEKSPQHPDSLFVAPTNLTERLLVDIWIRVLELDQVGISDNFFDLGGTSFSIVRVHQMIQHELAIEIPLVKLFEYPTIHSLASYLAGNQVQKRSNLEHGRRIAARRKRRLLGALES